MRRGGGWRFNRGDKELREGAKEQNISLKGKIFAAAGMMRRR